jgi:TetR/AcrR family transcriptional regulator, transcriptional repressor for nem operon
MGRRKGYDRETVLDSAMRLFWKRGYHATSTRDLTDTMGVNAYSLYAEFGSKEGLYAAAIAHYNETVVTGHFGGLEASDASLDTVRSVVRFFGRSAQYEHSDLGCLMCNAGTELAPTPAASRVTTTGYTRRLTASFVNALSNAQATGELANDAPVAELAHFLAVVLMGMFVMMRGQADDAVLRDTGERALASVEQFALPKRDAARSLASAT